MRNWSAIMARWIVGSRNPRADTVPSDRGHEMSEAHARVQL